jgi:hypothetical protein
MIRPYAFMLKSSPTNTQQVASLFQGNQGDAWWWHAGVLA